MRMPFIDQGTLVGDVIRLCPATLTVFTRHHLDLCCEAGYLLGLAAREHKLDLDRILEELNEVMSAG